MTTVSRKPTYQMSTEDFLALDTSELLDLDAKMANYLDRPAAINQTDRPTVRAQWAVVRAELVRRNEPIVTDNYPDRAAAAAEWDAGPNT